ncbi:MAG: hypothetical protein M1457_02785, partial [bacterium]|nr:hypothetical protein [bacterium]
MKKQNGNRPYPATGRRRRNYVWLALFLLIPQTVWALDFETMGYPKPINFREITPQLIPEYDWEDMTVSDLRVDLRKFADESWKQRFPGRPVLIQDGMWFGGALSFLPRQRLEDLGLLDLAIIDRDQRLEVYKTDIYPVTDFLGYLNWDAGCNSLNALPADTETVTIEVPDVVPFRPNTFPTTVNALRDKVGQDSYNKDVVICPRDGEGRLDWLNAELGSITMLDETAKTITVRRATTARGWPARAAGTYVAANANLMYDFNVLSLVSLSDKLNQTKVIQAFHPNLTRFCPRDPRTGFNAAEWYARHFVGVKQHDYPYSDGFAFDVSIGTFYPSARISDRVDCNLDGQVDNFMFDGVNYWPLGIHDFIDYMRHGSPGKFAGLGGEAALVWDSNGNEDQRLFDLLNGAEYEHSMIMYWDPYKYNYSSMLDRY